MKVILKIIRIQIKLMINIHYNTKLLQDNIQSKYSNKNLDQVTSLDMKEIMER